MIPVAVATCVLGARVVSGVLAGWLARRSARDLVVIVGVVLLSSSGVLLNVGIGALVRVNDVGGAFTTIADIAAWDSDGRRLRRLPDPWLRATSSRRRSGLLIRSRHSLSPVVRRHRACSLRAWSPPIQDAGGGRVRSAGLLDRILPASPVGAIAARTLRYFRRDPPADREHRDAPAAARDLHRALPDERAAGRVHRVRSGHHPHPDDQRAPHPARSCRWRSPTTTTRSRPTS